jgi:hypothetical protein
VTDEQAVAALDDAQAVALTLWGEARNQAIEGRFGVASVIRNRVQAQRPSFGLGFKQVCLKAWQFSTWLPQGGEQNYRRTMDTAKTVVAGLELPALVRECLWIADGLIAGAFGDTVRGANHYLTLDLYRTTPPKWTQGVTPTIQIGDHVFLKL